MSAPLPTARLAAAEAAAPFAGAVPSACASAVAIAQTSQVSNLAGKHRPQIVVTGHAVLGRIRHVAIVREQIHHPFDERPLSPFLFGVDADGALVPSRHVLQLACRRLRAVKKRPARIAGALDVFQEKRHRPEWSGT